MIRQSTLLLAVVSVGVAFLLGGGLDRGAASANEVERALNNRIHIGEDSDLAGVFDQIAGLEARGQYDLALIEYRRMIQRADRNWHNPPAGQEPRIMIAHWDTWASSAVNESGRPSDYYGQTFIPLREYCLRQIANLPRQIRDRYRDEIAVVAEQRLLDARTRRDRAAVQQVADDFWLAPAGIEAMDVAAHLAFEAGDFQTAIYYWERMWRYDPTTFGREALRAVKLAAAYRITDDTVGYAEIVTEARRKFDGLPAVLGRERFSNLLALLDADRLPEFFFGNHSPWIEPRGLSQIGGNARHSKPAPDFTRLGNVVGTLDISSYFRDARVQGGRMVVPGQPVEDMRNLFSVFPVALGNRLIVHGTLTGHFWDLPGPGAAAGSDRRIPISVEPFLTTRRSGDQQMFFRPGAAEARMFAPLIYRDRLYAVFRPRQMLTSGRRAEMQNDVLACFPVYANGAVEWVTPSNEADDTNAEHREFLQQIELNAAPAAGSGLIFVGGTHWVGREARYHVLAFDAETGKLAWTRKIASRLMETMHGMPNTTPDMAPLTFDDGLVYVETNAGAIAALDGLTGAVRWIFKYKRPANADGEMFNHMRQQARVSNWFNNPPLFSGGVGYFAPRDSEQMLVIHGRSGEFFRLYPESPDASTDAEYLLGISHGTLHVQGRRQGYGVDLSPDHRTPLVSSMPAGSAAAYETEYRYVTVPYSPNPSELNEADFIVGRGILTHSAVFVPTKRGLVRFNARTGILESEGFIPWPLDFDVASLGHCFVVAVPDGISAPNSPTIFPSDHLPSKATDVPLPGESAPAPRLEKRLFLVVCNPIRITLIDLE